MGFELLLSSAVGLAESLRGVGVTKQRKEMTETAKTKETIATKEILEKNHLGGDNGKEIKTKALSLFASSVRE